MSTMIGKPRNRGAHIGFGCLHSHCNRGQSKAQERRAIRRQERRQWLGEAAAEMRERTG
ncbi:hypothetical protein ACFV1N_25625 [Streptosporangium canum]|uniref:hypothetical protein n=1 Tax=Streptosporangium canum TaxID=324952 RepID=UPI0036C60873